jgi:hypothetical protein
LQVVAVEQDSLAVAAALAVIEKYQTIQYQQVMCL